MRALLPLALLFGCSNSPDDTTPTGSLWVTETGLTTTTNGSGDSGATSGSGGSGSGGSGVTPTIAVHAGFADVDVAGATWSGTESVRLNSVAAGDLLCEFTWGVSELSGTSSTTSTNNHATTDLPCTDADGNACTFSFDVLLSSGVQTFGNCSAFNLPPNGGLFHYGYVDSYFDLGQDLGATFVYWLPPASTATEGRWHAPDIDGQGTHSWDPATGALQYTIPHELLGPITP